MPRNESVDGREFKYSVRVSITRRSDNDLSYDKEVASKTVSLTNSWSLANKIYRCFPTVSSQVRPFILSPADIAVAGDEPTGE